MAGQMGDAAAMMLDSVGNQCSGGRTIPRKAGAAAVEEAVSQGPMGQPQVFFPPGFGCAGTGKLERKIKAPQDRTAVYDGQRSTSSS